MTVSRAQPASDHPVIEFVDVGKVYGTGDAAAHALRGVNLRIGTGEFVAVMGPSGSGKSTALNIMGCLDAPSSGSYRFNGIDVGGLSGTQKAVIRRNCLGFIFQGYNLLKRTSALENVELPLIYRNMPVAERRRRAREALASVGLDGFEDHWVNQLSGGQQQRIAIARAIVGEPMLLLADEPTGSLDSKTSREIMEVITAFNRNRRITVVMVTHEKDIAAYARRTINFHDGQIAGDAMVAAI